MNNDNASYAAEIRQVVAELFADADWDHSHLPHSTMRALHIIADGLSDEDTIDTWHSTGLTY